MSIKSNKLCVWLSKRISLGGAFGLSTKPMVYRHYPFSIGNSHYIEFSFHVAVFLCSEFFIMSHFTVNTTTKPMIFMCFIASTTI